MQSDICLFIGDSKWKLEDLGEGFRLKTKFDQVDLNLVAEFIHSRDWGLDPRFGKCPKVHGGFADFLEFEGDLLPKVSEDCGKDEFGLTCHWVNYDGLIFYQSEIMGDGSIFVFKSA